MLALHIHDYTLSWKKTIAIAPFKIIPMRAVLIADPFVLLKCSGIENKRHVGFAYLEAQNIPVPTWEYAPGC